MSTAAFCDGRKSGYYGNIKSSNPYRITLPNSIVGDQSANAGQWDIGYSVGQWLREAESHELAQALGRLGNAIKHLEDL